MGGGGGQRGDCIETPACSGKRRHMAGSLHLAVSSGNPGYLLTYLNQHPGMDVDVRDDSGDTALLLAAQTGNVVMLSILLARGADPLDGCHDDHECAIHRAASHGHVNVLRTLLDRGVDVNLTDHRGNSALAKAVAGDQRQAVRLLLEQEAELEECNEDGLTPLDIAVLHGLLEMVELLLEHGATVTPEGRRETALHLAADQDNAVMVELLLHWCTAEDVNAADENDQTALHRACQVADSPAISLLLDYDLDPNVRDKCGLTPLHLAAEQGNAAGVELLLAHGADVNASDNMQKTPLALAAMQGRMFFCSGSSNLDPNSHEETVQVLLEEGADLETADTCGLTPLYLAAERGCLHAALLMVSHGAKVNIVDEVDSSTPLHHAVRHGSKRLVRALLDAGACVDAIDSMANRPLDIVPQNVEPGCAILHDLLKAGAEYRKHNYSRFSVTLQLRRVRSAGVLLLMHGASLREFHNANFQTKTLWCSNLYKHHKDYVQLLLKHKTYLQLAKCPANLPTEQDAGKREQSTPYKKTLSLLNLSVIAIREHLVLLQKGKSIWKSVCSLDLPKPSKNALLLRQLDTLGELRYLK